MSENTTTQQPANPQALAVPPLTPLHEERIFALKQREAKALASSSMVPKEYQGNISNCIVAMEMAERTGASTLAVMQSLDVIHGRPGWRATFLIATVNTCGRFTSLRYRFQGERGTPSWGCCAVATDRETGDELVGETITIKMAQDEGWTKKTGSKWLTMPGQMLRYRAAAFWTRVYAPELSLGMHTSDEIEDIGASSQSNSNVGMITQLAGESPLVARLANQTVRESIVRTEPGDPPSSTPHDPETGEVLEREPTEREREPGDGEDELPEEFA